MQKNKKHSRKSIINSTSLGLSPFPVIVTTWTFTCLVGDTYKPGFACYRFRWEGGQPKTSHRNYMILPFQISNLLFFRKKKKQLSFQETPILNFPIRCHRVATWIFSQQCPHHWIPTSSDECQKWLTGTRQYATFVKPVAFELKTSRHRKKSRAVTATVKYHANCDTYLGANFESSREDQTTCRLVDPWLYECVANFGTLIHLILQPPEKNKNTKVHWNQSKTREGKWYTNHLSKCCSCQFSPLPNNPRKPQVCNFSYNPPIPSIYGIFTYIRLIFYGILLLVTIIIPYYSHGCWYANCKKLQPNLAWLCAPKGRLFLDELWPWVHLCLDWLDFFVSGWWFQSIWRKIYAKNQIGSSP